MEPTLNETICLVSFEVTAILLNGMPEERRGFWSAYRRELELNQKTNYHNYHVQLCKPRLASMKHKFEGPFYFRDGELISETPLPPPISDLKQTLLEGLAGHY